jgi:hypothetical protein
MVTVDFPHFHFLISRTHANVLYESSSSPRADALGYSRGLPHGRLGSWWCGRVWCPTLDDAQRTRIAKVGTRVCGGVRFVAPILSRRTRKGWSFQKEMQLGNGRKGAGSAGFTAQAGSRIEVQCPGCGNHHPHRLERRGFLEKKVLPKFGYYPWMCGHCRTSFLIRKRYRRKLRYTEQTG